MKLSEAISLLERIRSQGGDADLVVALQNAGGLGGTPGVAVTGIHAGFDWDAGRVLISTARPVIGLSAKDVEVIRASAYRGSSWHAYQLNKRLREKIKELEQRLSETDAVK